MLVWCGTSARSRKPAVLASLVGSRRGTVLGVRLPGPGARFGIRADTVPASTGSTWTKLGAVSPGVYLVRYSSWGILTNTLLCAPTPPPWTTAWARQCCSEGGMRAPVDQSGLGTHVRTVVEGRHCKFHKGDTLSHAPGVRLGGRVTTLSGLLTKWILDQI